MAFGRRNGFSRGRFVIGAWMHGPWCGNKYVAGSVRERQQMSSVPYVITHGGRSFLAELHQLPAMSALSSDARRRFVLDYVTSGGDLAVTARERRSSGSDDHRRKAS